MKKKLVSTILASSVCLSPLLSEEEITPFYDPIENTTIDTEALWDNNGGSDGSFTSTSTSMVAWGIGLAIGIGLLAGILHQSAAPSTTTQ
jgi:hypothetical protein